MYCVCPNSQHHAQLVRPLSEPWHAIGGMCKQTGVQPAILRKFKIPEIVDKAASDHGQNPV